MTATIVDIPMPPRSDLAAWQASTGLPIPFTATGLSLPEHLTYSEWEAYGGPVLGAARASMWWVGDWILAGEHRFGTTYLAAVDLTGLSVSTLKSAVSVCRRVPVEARRPDLSFGHHAEVAGTAGGTPAMVDWLERAAEAGWSRDELRAELRASVAVPAESRPAPTPTVGVARLVLLRDHAPAALTLLERAERVLRPHLTPAEVEVLAELLTAVREVQHP